MNRRDFLGLSLKAGAVAPIAAVGAIILQEPDLLAKGKDIPLEVPPRDPSLLIEGAALISNNKIVAKRSFACGLYLIPGDEINVRWTCQGYYHDPSHPLPTQYARELALKEINDGPYRQRQKCKHAKMGLEKHRRRP